VSERASEPGGSPVDREFYDELYRSTPAVWSARPNRQLVVEASDLSPGAALDAGCGEGADALWLAERGWRVTAVDFSAVGLARGAAQPGAERVSWVTADVTTWTAPPASQDLVVVAYLHLSQDDTVAVLTRAVGWLRPGGRLLVLGHDLANIDHGVGGPQEPTILHSVDRLAPVAELLTVDRLEQVRRETPAGTALDTLLWGRRPA
jgi:SAM-dependent methyltransferase